MVISEMVKEFSGEFGSRMVSKDFPGHLLGTES